MRALWRDEDGAWRTTLRGRQVLADPRINKGTAFGDRERRDLGLTGLIPAALYRFRTRHGYCDVRLGRMNRLRQDRGLCPSACSTCS
jgi:hypothetical protein